MLRLDFVSTNEAGSETESNLARAFLPGHYIEQSRTRIQAYRALAEIMNRKELEKLSRSWRDRFGPLPKPVENLLLMSEIKLAAAQRKMTVVEVRDSKVMLTRAGDLIQIGGKFPRLTAESPDVRLSDLYNMVKAF